MQPTHKNIAIRNAHDAHTIFYGVEQNLLPLVTRRLTDDEKRHIGHGQVYVWKDSPSQDGRTGIQRWTDGKHWTNSRCREDFLIYTELLPEDDASGVPPLSKHTYTAKLTNGTPSETSEKWHLVTYYRQSQVESTPTISTTPELALLQARMPNDHFRAARKPKDDGVARSQGEAHSPSAEVVNVTPKSSEDDSRREPRRRRSPEKRASTSAGPRPSSSWIPQHQSPTLPPLHISIHTPSHRPRSSSRPPRRSPAPYPLSHSPPRDVHAYRHHNTDEDYLSSPSLSSASTDSLHDPINETTRSKRPDRSISRWQSQMGMDVSTYAYREPYTPHHENVTLDLPSLDALNISHFDTAAHAQDAADKAEKGLRRRTDDERQLQAFTVAWPTYL